MRPYEYQKKVAHHLLVEKRNVILQAPTGAGKTHAAMLPFLTALERNHEFPARCIYSVPMRILANQFVEDYQPKVIKAGRSDKIKVTIQTGESSGDPQLAGNLIFATIDQTLSSFLISPYSLSRSKANLNAGAVLSSYLVFDEFHLFDPYSTLPTTLHILKMLKGITPFVLMTATFSRTMLDELAGELDAVVIGQSEEERAKFANLPSQQKQRFYHAVDDVLSADIVLAQHQKRSLVICNTVERARTLFENIREKAGNIEVFLLHSQLLPEHRQAKSDLIRSHFAGGNTDGDYIVISTQAIEVGVDMTSMVLHTELAPANAIIQRAGRCARYEGETGHVYIYRRAINKGEETDLIENYMPYQGQGDVIAKTWAAFAAANDTRPLTYSDEQAVLSAAHEAQDADTIQRLREANRNHRQDMYAVMRGDTGTDARNLIRHIVSQQVTVHDNPAEVAKNPFAYPSFGLHPGTVQGYLEAWLQSPDYESSKDIQAIRPNEDESAAQANEERFYADPVIDKKSGFMATLLVVHPRLATYDDELGFIADEGGTWVAELDKKSSREKPRNNFTYRLETYEKHITHVYQAFTEFWSEAQWAAQQLERRYGWADGSVTKAAQLAVLLHDVGKLSTGWQGWVRKYQAAIGTPVTKGEAYAHTELKHEKHREIERRMGRRPWHAVEGAYAVLDILMNELNENEDLALATYSAIARHHTALSSEHQTFQLERNALDHIAATFAGRLAIPDLSALLGISEAVDKHSDAADFIKHPEDDMKAFLAYLLIVRALRRADSIGTQRGSVE